MIRRNASLLINSRGIQQPSGPSHDTTQSNKPPILAAAFVYSRRVCWRDKSISAPGQRRMCMSLACAAACSSGIWRETIGWCRDGRVSCLAPSSSLSGRGIHTQAASHHTHTHTCPTLSPHNLRLTRGARRARRAGLGDQNQLIAAIDLVRWPRRSQVKRSPVTPGPTSLGSSVARRYPRNSMVSISILNKHNCCSPDVRANDVSWIGIVGCQRPARGQSEIVVLTFGASIKRRRAVQRPVPSAFVLDRIWFITTIAGCTRVLACATPTWISTQTTAAWPSGTALAAPCCKVPCSHPPLYPPRLKAPVSSSLMQEENQIQEM